MHSNKVSKDLWSTYLSIHNLNKQRDSFYTPKLFKAEK